MGSFSFQASKHITCGEGGMVTTNNDDYALALRRISGKILEDAMDSCNWLTPQYTPDECEHTYWAVAARMVNPKITWYDFRRKFMELGGDGIYSA